MYLHLYVYSVIQFLRWFWVECRRHFASPGFPKGDFHAEINQSSHEFEKMWSARCLVEPRRHHCLEEVKYEVRHSDLQPPPSLYSRWPIESYFLIFRILQSIKSKLAPQNGCPLPSAPRSHPPPHHHLPRLVTQTRQPNMAKLPSFRYRLHHPLFPSRTHRYSLPQHGRPFHPL